MPLTIPDSDTPTKVRVTGPGLVDLDDPAQQVTLTDGEMLELTRTPDGWRATAGYRPD